MSNDLRLDNPKTSVPSEAYKNNYDRIFRKKGCTLGITDSENKEINMESSLGKAISMWRNGQHIPLDLFAALNEEGYDVASLENRYFNYDN